MAITGRDGFFMAKKGNIPAFEKLMSAYEGRIFNIALAAAGSRERASELAQEVFVRVYKSMARLESEGQLPALVYRTAKIVCVDECDIIDAYSK
ncbi:sigma-70-like protein [Anaerobacterium chartisolvens]|uniref:Sigma-70-like protein n=1 Tax=Anaerobacterium chartisolvens TaxID=1297424 RepID=A0A369B4Y9_9FIRM|nr:sigma-70 family RNA polymerase sigma factor [Anaerobacterium chartisolvens]RCX16385.1 sigma-70-like protein [Anaerobacterium chartisolvens]